MDERFSNSVIIEAEGLRKYFPVRRGFLQKTIGWIKAVDGVDLTISKGKTLGLVGESGCGKSTVGRLLLRLLEPDDGEIFFQGESLSDLAPSQMKALRRKMQIIFQDPYGSLNPRMTVGQSVGEGLRVMGLEGRKERRERIEHLMEMVGMPPNSADRYPHEFSGGQRQRIGIARALSIEPSFIVCDEPVSSLDVSIQAQIINLLRELQTKLGLSYLFIAHDLNVVEYVGDCVAIMYLGHIVEYILADELFDHALHPYSKALLSAIPVPEPGIRQHWTPLSGEVPSPFNPPPGCKFQKRCPLVEERCCKDEIPLYDVEENHRVRCWKVV